MARKRLFSSKRMADASAKAINKNKSPKEKKSKVFKLTGGKYWVGTSKGAKRSQNPKKYHCKRG